MRIMITGGAGYIGSHTCLELLQAGHEATVIDNLSNSSEESLRRVEKITGKKIIFHKADICDMDALQKIFTRQQFDGVLHFAGLKAVGESVTMPLQYYANNVYGTVVLCEAMQKHNIKNLIFSSSATVYGDPATVPITEEFPLNPTNPYGRTKYFIEEILKDISISDPAWKIILLRYFNPIGAHESGLIGENPAGIPNNLMPYITQVAIGKHPELQVYGNDYPTHDGTGVRDYLHVVDLAKGHLAALYKLKQIAGVEIYNLGTGTGYSVLDIVTAFEKEAGIKIPYRITGRRPGDIATCYADPSKAGKDLGWKAEKTIHDMCRDSWNWQYNNPGGY
jgi:UDP-glucose 4-epimerase